MQGCLGLCAVTTEPEWTLALVLKSLSRGWVGKAMLAFVLIFARSWKVGGRGCADCCR